MKSLKRLRRVGVMAALPLACLLSACDATPARYRPTTDEARGSLESALNAWRDGKPYGPISGTPPIQVADSAWQAGQAVESFEIGAEEDGDEGTKQFTVKLKMTKPPGEQSVRYMVHGREPFWVYREEDYKRMLDMDNNPVPASSSKSGARRSGRQR